MTVNPACRYTWANDVGTRNAKQCCDLGVHLESSEFVTVPSRLPKRIGAAIAVLMVEKYWTGFAGRVGVVPSSTSPTAPIVTVRGTVVVTTLVVEASRCVDELFASPLVRAVLAGVRTMATMAPNM